MTVMSETPDSSRDRLRMDFINSLPQPLWADTFGAEWPIYDIDVQTGLLRIDVCGMLEVKHIDDLRSIRDDGGTVRDIEVFYCDYLEDAPPAEPVVGTLPRADLDRLYAAVKPDPEEQLAVTMTRARWGAMLDHLNAELEPKLKDGRATNAEIDIVVHLACALISAGASRMEHQLVEHMLKGGEAAP